MYRGNPPRRSPHVRDSPPSVVVSLAVAVLFAGTTLVVFAAVTNPVLAVAFAAGVLTAVAVHVFRVRRAGRVAAEQSSSGAVESSA